jgi:hypothetical protein
MRSFIFLVTISLALVVPTCYSKGHVGTEKIDKVAFHTGGFFMYANDWENPNSCSINTAVVLLDTDVNYEKAYSLLLAAYMAGKRVSGYSDGCASFDGQTYNTIRGFKYLQVQ